MNDRIEPNLKGFKYFFRIIPNSYFKLKLNATNLL